MQRISAVLVSVIGCRTTNGPHVNLTAPLPHASTDERRLAFTRVKSDGQGIKTYDPFTLGSGPGPRKYIQLADGTKVWNPEDLLAVVREDSPTGRAIGQMHRGYRKQRNAVLMMIGGAIVGGGVMAGGIVLVATQDKQAGERSNAGVSLATVGLVAVLASLGYGFVAMRKADKLVDDGFTTSFQRYDESLAAALKICTRGIELVDCETGR